ncbi:MAG: AEC family transporter [Clostridia bacterium]|nr:AEC family transporter [Clostridia bacterium]
MDLFLATLNQMGFLFLLIFIGFILVKTKILPEGSAKVLSRLESYFFIPAMVMLKFMQEFTVERLSTSWLTIVISFAIAFVMIPIVLVISKLLTKNITERNAYIYGLCFSNFGFMGNAVVQTLFPEIMLEYVIFTIPLWTLIYVWGVPFVLTEREDSEGQNKLLTSLKALVNPMFIALIIGVVLGLTGVNAHLPQNFFITQVIKAGNDCMSPVAMLITGITFGTMNFSEVFKKPGIYIASVIRLIIIPFVMFGIFSLIPVPEVVFKCIMIVSAMPLGLNSIVIPASYGKDTSAAAGMALVSHIISLATIPLFFMLVLA